VSDRGPGISPEHLEKLFMPFFTTKSEGMGMGLNICRTIVEHHQGRLYVEANEGGGSRFIVSLPLILHTQTQEVETHAV
jgi:signal transduction histidine kinase